MLQLTIGFIVVMYCFGAVLEETGVIPNTRLEHTNTTQEK